MIHMPNPITEANNDTFYNLLSLFHILEFLVNSPEKYQHIYHFALIAHLLHLLYSNIDANRTVVGAHLQLINPCVRQLT